MIERGVLTQAENRVLEIDSDNCLRLLFQLFSGDGRGSQYGRRQHQALQRPQPNSICKSYKIKLTENIALSCVHPLPEPVSEEGIAS